MKMTLLNKKVLPALTGKRVATISKYEEVANDKGGYVKAVLKLEDREYNYCIFPTQVDYVVSAIRRQLDNQELDTLADVLDAAKTTPIDVYFTYNADLGRMNVAFHESKLATEEAVDLDI